MSYFKGKDLGVINASPTGMGILNNSGTLQEAKILLVHPKREITSGALKKNLILR